MASTPSQASTLPEVSAVAAWVEAQVEKVLSPAEARGLGAALEKVLSERFEGHWFPSEPDRGCAYRLLECAAHHLDKPLAKAATVAKVNPADVQRALCKLQNPGGTVRIWANPGEVKVLTRDGTQHIFGASASTNPYDHRLRLKIEKTSVVVSSGDEGSSDGSRPATPDGVSPARSRLNGMPALELSPGSAADPWQQQHRRAASLVDGESWAAAPAWAPLAASDAAPAPATRLARSSSLNASAAAFEWGRPATPGGASRLSAAAPDFEVAPRWSIGVY